ncbi:hypothetical protein [Phycicoccus avicenniae]|uniref:hypothetical protein n=1 Tax=Phycicoccus avicenniae TaxID=2828860 RepID=UPI003D2BBBDD
MACTGRARTQEDLAMPPVKKIVMWLVVVFLLYAILTSPDSAANIFGSAWDVIAGGVSNIGRFFDSLLRG